MLGLFHGSNVPLTSGPSSLGPRRARTDNRGLFVRSFAEVDRPFEEVRVIVLDRPHLWLPGLATDAGWRGEVLLAEVGFGKPPTRVAEQILIELFSPVEFPSRVILPLEWRPVSARMFPKLEGDLEIAPLGPRRTHLSLSAGYRPPLGVVGRALDRALLHRVAEATVKDFVDRVSDALGVERVAG